MNRYILFVDVDGTLINEDDKFEDNINGPLVAAIYEVIEQTPADLVVWSGGGAGYAWTWANRIFPNVPCLVSAKDNGIPEPNDIVVDDMLEFRVVEGVYLYTPQQFIDEWEVEKYWRWYLGD